MASALASALVAAAAAFSEGWVRPATMTGHGPVAPAALASPEPAAALAAAGGWPSPSSRHLVRVDWWWAAKPARLSPPAHAGAAFAAASAGAARLAVGAGAAAGFDATMASGTAVGKSSTSPTPRTPLARTAQLAAAAPDDDDAVEFLPSPATASGSGTWRGTLGGLDREGWAGSSASAGALGPPRGMLRGG